MRFIELFAGIGLFRYGLESSGAAWECVFANDISEAKARAYALNFDTSEFRLGDIRQLKASDLPMADCLTASFPCQDISLAGKYSGLGGERSGLFYEVIRLLQGMQEHNRIPSQIVFENVASLLTSGNGKDIQLILGELNTLGYGVDVLFLDAASWLPQSRPRLFIIGSQSKKSFSPLNHSARPLKIQKLIKQNPQIHWQLLDLLDLPLDREFRLDDLMQPDTELWFNKTQETRELSYIRDASQVRVQAAWAAAKADGVTRYLPAYRRMRRGEVCLEVRDDGLAGCLRTPTGGSSRQLVVAAQPDGIKVRWMTPREYARLMGVPDTFRIPENTREALYGFGDGVAVPVIRWLGQVLANHHESELRPVPAPLLVPAV